MNFFSLFCWLTFHFCESACWAASHENTTSLASIVCMCTVQKPSGNSKQHNSPDRNIHYRWHRSAWARYIGAGGSCWCRLRASQQRNSLFPAGIFCILTPSPVCIMHEIMCAYRVNAWACFVPAHALYDVPLSVAAARKGGIKSRREGEKWARLARHGTLLKNCTLLHRALLALITFMKFHHECSTQLSSSLLLAWKSIWLDAVKLLADVSFQLHFAGCTFNVVIELLLSLKQLNIVRL